MSQTVIGFNLLSLTFHIPQKEREGEKLLLMFPLFSPYHVEHHANNCHVKAGGED